MDPLTHALAGAAAAYALVGRRLGRRAAAVGAAAALLPDADVFIRSAADPLLAIEHHRGFTHSFVFMPVGGALAAAPWLPWRAARGRRLALVLAATAGYATHGPLDAATSYGTRLFWPFSDHRVGLDWIAIIDPLFTLLLLTGLALALRRARTRPAVAALLLCLGYLGLGALERARALAVQQRLAEARGHERVRGEVFPTFANNLVWRSLYQAGDSLYADRIRVAWAGPPSWTPGTAVARLQPADLPAEKRADPRIRRDFQRFAWFSGGWVARAPGEPDLIGDVRYSLATDGFEPVWGVRFDPQRPERPTEWVDRSRQRELRLSELWREIAGRDPAYRPLPAAARLRAAAGACTMVHLPS